MTLLDVLSFFLKCGMVQSITCRAISCWNPRSENEASINDDLLLSVCLSVCSSVCRE